MNEWLCDDDDVSRARDGFAGDERAGCGPQGGADSIYADLSHENEELRSQIGRYGTMARQFQAHAERSAGTRKELEAQVAAKVKATEREKEQLEKQAMRATAPPACLCFVCVLFVFCLCLFVCLTMDLFSCCFSCVCFFV